MEWILFILGMAVGVCGYGVYHFFERRRIQKEQLEEDQRFSGLVGSTKDIIYYFEKKPGFQFRYVMPPLEHFFGEEMAKEAFVDPSKFFYLVHPDDLEMLWKKIRGEVDYNQPIIYRINDRKGGYTWYEEYTTPVYKDGEIVALQGILRNISEKIKLQEELEYRINHDDLTGLFNRGYFEKVMEKYDSVDDSSAAVIMCDLDDLKHVNDHFGHKAGDLLIKTAASILNGFASDQLVVARMGGDEFALLATGFSRDHVESMVRDITDQVNSHRIDTIGLSVNLSIGYAFCDHSLYKMDKLLNEADQNMYRNKKNRKLITI